MNDCSHPSTDLDERNRRYCRVCGRMLDWETDTIGNAGP